MAVLSFMNLLKILLINNPLLSFVITRFIIIYCFTHVQHCYPSHPRGQTAGKIARKGAPHFIDHIQVHQCSPCVGAALLHQGIPKLQGVLHFSRILRVFDWLADLVRSGVRRHFRGEVLILPLHEGRDWKGPPQQVRGRRTHLQGQLSP